MRPIFCSECGREHGSGRADDRWYVFFTLRDGVDVVPFDPEIVEFAAHFACGDQHAGVMFSRWLASRKLEKPIDDLPPYVIPGMTMHCMTPGCEFRYANNPASAAVTLCPRCGGGTFSSKAIFRTQGIGI